MRSQTRKIEVRIQISRSENKDAKIKLERPLFGITLIGNLTTFGEVMRGAVSLKSESGVEEEGH